MIYDVAVVGLGGAGLAVAHEASRAGLRVVGLQATEVGEPQGSSSGETRLYRLVHEDERYGGPLRESYRGFQKWSHAAGEPLTVETGQLLTGPKAWCSSLREAGRRVGTRVTPVEPADVVSRWPALGYDLQQPTVFAEEAGVILVRNTLRALSRLARRNGAELLGQRRVLLHERLRSGAHLLTTETQQFHARRVVLTVGPWAVGGFWKLPFPLRLARAVQVWFTQDAPSEETVSFVHVGDSGPFYGGVVPHAGVLKVGGPSTGSYSRPDPCFIASPEEAGAVLSFAKRRFGLESSSAMRTWSSPTTWTPDGRFALGELPASPGTFVALGLSGHGFKLLPWIGRTLARALKGEATAIPEWMDVRRLCR